MEHLGRDLPQGAYEAKRKPRDDSEPGDDPKAPYYRLHQIATGIPSAFSTGVRYELGSDFRLASRSRRATDCMIDLSGAAGHHPERRCLLPYRGGDLVADTLADDLALELRKGQQHVEGQSPH